MLTQLTPQMIEGMMGIATATEFEPPATNTAKEIIEAYTAVNGKWDSPDLTPLTVFYALTAALQKAGSLDTDRVAEVLGNGLEFDVSEGTARMIARPDLGINRTIDCVMTNYIKKVNNGKATLFNKVGIDEANGYIQKILSAHP
ncbi:MAG: hypothetical protein A2Z02_05185 [Chloroflexi bacterium RBG_16_48_7]|nr:MAG: hypothetical protein A2Z02_05185 [Chloroflexi bacterium RBG_16_48_7]